MDDRKEKEMDRSELELDYVKVVGDLRGFDASRREDRKSIREFLKTVGLKEIKSGDDWVYYENKDAGLRVYFSNYPSGGQKLYKRPTLSFDCSGHFFIRQNSYIALRTLLLFFTDHFGVYFKTTRVDIRQDIYDAKYPFDYFPNFLEEKSKLEWSLRGRPSFNRYNNSFKDQETGFSIKTSRYQIMSYNRHIAIQDRYSKGEITYEYYTYYKKLYKKRDVQRLEISLKQDACNFFSLLFYKGEHSKEEVLEMTMSNFGRNHQLKTVTPGSRKDKWPMDPIFEELFYLKRKEDVKMFKTIFQEKAGIKISEVAFSDRGRSPDEIATMAAKKICELAKDDDISREQYKNDFITKLTRKIYDFKNAYIDKVERFKATLNFMNFDMMGMIDSNREIRFHCHSETG
ncbi:hypothetical protein HON22_05665 [Candidatus Peregrinibacteria bacterium]|jgi:hypothetical protein|nr:hypothetical protein [Candidatus Peregrinibacteria bacterium]